MNFNIKNLEKLTLDRAIIYHCYKNHCFDDSDLSYKLFRIAVAIDELKENAVKYDRIPTWDISRSIENFKIEETQDLFNKKEKDELNNFLKILTSISKNNNKNEQLILIQQLDDDFVKNLYQKSEIYFLQNKDKLDFEKESELFFDLSEDEELFSEVISTSIKNIETELIDSKGEEIDLNKEVDKQIRYSLFDIFDESINDEYGNYKDNNTKTILSFFENVLNLFNNDIEQTTSFLQNMMVDKNENKIVPEGIETTILEILKNEELFEEMINNDFFSSDIIYISDYFINDNFYVNLNKIVDNIKNKIEPVSVSNVNYHEMNYDLGNINSLEQSGFYDLLKGIVYGFENEEEYLEIKNNFEMLLEDENQEQFNSGIINFLNQCGISLEDIKENINFIDDEKKIILKSIVDLMDNSTTKNCQAFTYLTNMSNENIIKTKAINNLKTSFSITKDVKEKILSSLPEIQITIPAKSQYGIVNPALGGGDIGFLTSKDIVLNAKDCEIMHGFYKYNYNSYRYTVNDIFLLTKKAFGDNKATLMIINNENQDLKVNQVFEINKMDGNQKQFNLGLEYKIDSKIEKVKTQSKITI